MKLGELEVTPEMIERDRDAFFRYMGDRTLNAWQALEKYRADPDRLPWELGNYGSARAGYMADTDGFRGSV